MTCQDLSTEGLSGSKRNGIPDRSTLHGVRVSVERFVETAQLSFECVLDVLLVRCVKSKPPSPEAGQQPRTKGYKVHTHHRLLK